jgi:hypothetical protein
MTKKDLIWIAPIVVGVFGCQIYYLNKYTEKQKRDAAIVYPYQDTSAYKMPEELHRKSVNDLRREQGLEPIKPDTSKHKFDKDYIDLESLQDQDISDNDLEYILDFY